MKRKAIVSVSDKTGLVEFVKKLILLDVEIISTGGTAKYLIENGVTVVQVDSYTGHPEILEGRVKTLHPKVHGGILARRDNARDVKELQENNISPIDFVIVNLYPFTSKIRDIEQKKDPNHESLIEFIDIGGPTLIRASAKNYEHVVVISSPSDYAVVLSELEKTGDVSKETRRRLAAKVFATMAAYDASIARYLSLGEKLLEENGEPKQCAPYEGIILEEKQKLRYGENPHQIASLYAPVVVGGDENGETWKQLQGKEISYNNLLDMQAAVDLLVELLPDAKTKAASVIIKHLNPCGVAIRDTLLTSYKAARECDPVSAFGGVVAVSGTVEREVAECILEGFVEIVVAEHFSPEALQTFSSKKNVRVVTCDYQRVTAALQKGYPVIRNSFNGFLLQSVDNQLTQPSKDRVVAGQGADDKMLSDAAFAWKVCKHVKSNAIVICKNLQAIGIGAGQMSRVDSAKISLLRAELHGFSVEGAVAASDAFLPFADTLQLLNDKGVGVLVQPGGSIRDEEVIEEAKKRNVTMIFTGERHFRH